MPFVQRHETKVALGDNLDMWQPKREPRIRWRVRPWRDRGAPV